MLLWLTHSTKRDWVLLSEGPPGSFFMMISLGYIISEALFVLEKSAMRRVRYHLTIIWDAVSCWGCRSGYHSHLPHKKNKVFFLSLKLKKEKKLSGMSENCLSNEDLWVTNNVNLCEFLLWWNGKWLACRNVLTLSVPMQVFRSFHTVATKIIQPPWSTRHFAAENNLWNQFNKGIIKVLEKVR